MASRKASKKAPDVLSAAYLESTSNKNELLRRLSNIIEHLTTLSDDLDPSTHPGLLSLSTCLVSPTILAHRDKDVRLNAVLAAMELFYIYAPEPPWETFEILEIFNQMVRQLGNLHGTDVTSASFETYFRILEQLSEVKIGVVLVDLIRTERGTRTSTGGGGGNKAEDGENDALETLCDLIRTLLTCASVDHPPEVAAHAELAVAACIEEFEGSVPIPVLEELLSCVGQGPVVWVTNPAFAGSKKRKSPGSGGKKKGDDAAAAHLPPPQIQQTNPAYLVAAKVLRRTEDKISSPIAALLNGLLTGDPNVMDRTSLSTVDAEAAAESPKSSGKKKRGKKGESAPDDNGKEDSSPTLASHLAPKDKDSSGANVYSICYELHRIAPQILTTVIGTVSTSLVNTDLTKRWQATKLLGRLFGARSSDIAGRFGPCFREWLRRSYDPEPKIRETMVKCLINFLTTQHTQTDRCVDVNEALAAIIERDPTLDIRLLGIHQVCDLAHGATVSTSSGSEGIAAAPGSGADSTSNGSSSSSSSNNKLRSHPISVISPELLQAVGNRVSSKNKTEHKDAITGLAQVYHKHYMRQTLRFVQEGGEDVAIDEILEVWKELNAGTTTATGTGSASKKDGKESSGSLEEVKFGWIPQRVFECVSFADATDAEMRNRIFQIVDDVLLGTTKKDSGSTLTPTSRAVGLALIVNSVKSKENAFKWMCTLFSQRSRLQKALAGYLDARSKLKECESGSAEAFAADSDAVEKLELVASLSAPIESKSPGAATDLESILKKFHGAKDKHIFRILSTIASPSHSPSARLRAFDELPKRTKGLGSAAQSWVKTLARRCAMGSFLNAESIEHCIILSQEAFEAESVQVSMKFLEVVKMATSVFPSLGSTPEGFKNLVEFFDMTRTSTSMSASMKRDMEKYGVVTTLSEILARSGTANAASGSRTPSSSGKKKRGKEEDFDFDEDDSNDDEKKKASSSYDTLREQLLRLCTRDGTPEQARNSVYTISSMIQPAQSPSSPKSESSLAARVRKEKKEFEPLLKALVSPSRLSIPDDSTSPKSRGRIVSILSAIAAIAECAPYAFNAKGEKHKLGWGQRALEFALDTVLLGKNDGRLSHASAGQEEDGSDSEDGEDEEFSPKKGRSTKSAKQRGKKKANEAKVSVHCQMLCGAIEVLVSHVRSTIVNSRRSTDNGKSTLKPPSSEHIKEVFTTLSKIIEDGGIPPSSVNGRYCSTPKDQAALRLSAAINLLRLCDANLQLEAAYLTPRSWHILSSILLDADKSVRSSFMDELCSMYTGSSKYRAHGSAPLAPSLRFVALATLCADGDGHSGQHPASNANAANVGPRKSSSVKNASTNLIKMLRTTCQQVAAQCRVQGRKSEKNFETRLKMKLMPEYCVPYALHLLAFRHETASAAGTLAGENDTSSDGEESKFSDMEEGELVHSREASQKMLKKRLRWLFDPLILSLGAGADNISFLMRMVELISKHPPVNVLKPPNLDISSLEMSLDDASASSTEPTTTTKHPHDVSEKEAAARMKIICQFAREVLLSHVKKDVNLTVYPGSIQIPGNLYAARAKRSSTSPLNVYESEESEEETKRKKRRPKKSISHYVKKTNEEEDEMMSDDEKSDDEEDKSAESKSIEDKSAEDDQSLGKSADSKSDAKYDDKFILGQSKEDLSGTPNSGDTYEHSLEKSDGASPSFSPVASPQLSSDNDNDDDFDTGFGDVSPIAKADSPAVAVDSAPRGRRKKRPSSAAPQAVAKSKKTSTEGKKKRKSHDINVFDEFPSPMTDGDSPPKKRKSTSTPKVSKRSSVGKNKPKGATPISVPKSVMVNVTNSASSSGSAAPSQKKRASSKKTQKKTRVSAATASMEMEEDDFDFSDSSPVKPKKKAPSRKKSTTSAEEKKAAPARKARAPAKAKISTGKPSVAGNKTKVATGKAAAKTTKVAASASKKTSSRRGKTPVEKASPSTTSEASSRPSPVLRGARRSARASRA